MRHRVKSKRLNRNRAHLDAMLKNMATSIILYEKIRTTQAKAKMIKPVVEKLISNAKRQSTKSLPVAIRKLKSYLPDSNASKKITQELLERYKDRNSGFVRITQIGFRPGDGAPIVMVELV